jgi:hypothetical protein
VVYLSAIASATAEDRRTGSPAVPSAVIDRRYNLAVRLLLGFIRFYQRVVSPLPPALFGASCGCRFSPTCSHYAAEAVRTHGTFGGLWLALRRLAKCTPLHRGGFDPVPPSLTLWRTGPPSSKTRPACVRVSATPLASGL